MLDMAMNTELIRLEHAFKDYRPPLGTEAALRAYLKGICTEHYLHAVMLYSAGICGETTASPLISVVSSDRAYGVIGDLDQSLRTAGILQGSTDPEAWLLKYGHPDLNGGSALVIRDIAAGNYGFAIAFCKSGDFTSELLDRFFAISAAVAECRLGEMLDKIGHAKSPPNFRLSQRETECMHWTANGKTSEDIAIILCLSVHTVNHYLTSATRKLNATNRLHAVAKAMRHGLLKFDEFDDDGKSQTPRKSTGL